MTDTTKLTISISTYSVKHLSYRFYPLIAHCACSLKQDTSNSEIETLSRVIILANKDELYNLRSENKNLDIVLQALLRQYTGLFADYVFINEEYISKKYNLSLEDIYEALLTLTRMHILHYVPRKRTPYIIFTTSREEIKYVLIPKTIYEEQKKRIDYRINYMEQYAYSTDVCREKIMLEYFGDNTINDCGTCDVCISKRKQHSFTDNDIIEGVMYMVSNKPRTIHEFINTLSFPKDDIIRIVSRLTDEQILTLSTDEIYTKQ